MISKERQALAALRPWAAAAGICLAGASTVMVWARTAPAGLAPGAAAALYVSEALVNETAFDLTFGRSRVGWLVMAGAVGYGVAALADPSGAVRQMRLVREGLALAVLALAVAHLGPYPGVAMALAGGFLMLWAAAREPSIKEAVE